MGAIISGERELALKFDEFPYVVRDRLEVRLTELIESLKSRVEGTRPVTPGKSGKLHSEIAGRVYSSNHRVAGYVSIYAPGEQEAYAKAAALEYGSNKPRRQFMRQGRLAAMFTSSRRRIVAKLSKPVHLEAYRYLRGPFTDTENEFREVCEEVLAEALHD